MYTAEELVWATQLAYCDFKEEYYGHHILNVAEHPEYAGDWRTIQALDYDEYYKGAHACDIEI